MKYLTALTALWLPLLLSATGFPPLQFVDASPAEVRRMAARQEKLYLIHFAADWCMPSQWMEENTFRDEALSSFLEAAFLALRADIDRPEGQALKAQYGITILPSLLVFSAQGQLLGLHEGAMEPEALFKLLKAYDKPSNRMPAALVKKEENLLPSPRPTFALSRPALIPDAPAATTVSGFTLSSPTPATPPPPSAYFTIQAGVFSSYSNAVRYCARLEAEGKLPAEVAPCRLNGQSQYKVFLGHFSSQAEAAIRLKALRRTGIDGFVKIIDK